MVLSDAEVLLSYRAEFRRPGPRSQRETMFVSSLWSHRDGRWVNVFSQDTPAVLTEIGAGPSPSTPAPPLMLSDGSAVTHPVASSTRSGCGRTAASRHERGTVLPDASTNTRPPSASPGVSDPRRAGSSRWASCSAERSAQVTSAVLSKPSPESGSRRAKSRGRHSESDDGATKPCPRGQGRTNGDQPTRRQGSAAGLRCATCPRLPLPGIPPLTRPHLSGVRKNERQTSVKPPRLRPQWMTTRKGIRGNGYRRTGEQGPGGR